VLFRSALVEWAIAVDKKITSEMGHESQAWQERSFDDSDWKPMILPTLWEESGLANYDGLTLFRKTIELPADWAGQNVVLELGKIDDQDITWFNGVRVGAMQRPDQQRIYSVPRQLVRAGKNVIAVQVNDTGGEGGLYGPEELMWLKSDDQNPVSLSGAWKYKAIVQKRDLPRVPSITRPQNTPTLLYNAMIHPLLQFPVQGSIWYQGESNAGRAQEYRTLFPLMIRDWRKNWQDDSLDFYFVQLANFKERNVQPGESDWAELREAQTLALDLPLTGMAVTIDIGKADDIHPRNKQDVGKRLAQNALHTTYGQDVVPCGPFYRDMKIVGSEIHLSFDHVADGLVTPDMQPLLGFSIAGQDRRFVWADAQIQGEQVVVSSPQVTEPVAVRYAWSDNPACNLYNSANLPALPFRTDDWPGITRDRVWGQ
jgi:sialate O-acetylesterase